MPAFGGLVPSPERTGGGRPTLVTILNALNEARGSAYDTSTTSYVWVENMAIARAIWDVWETNQRMANQFDALRVTTMLERWEKILAIVPGPDDTDVARRARVAALIGSTGVQTTYQKVCDVLDSLLGSIPYTIEYNDPDDAGTVVFWPGGTTNTDTPWYSTALKFLIIVTKPSGMGDEEFYERMGSIFWPLLEILPAWVTFRWVRDGSVPGEFRLDEEHNLDNQRFA